MAQYTEYQIARPTRGTTLHEQFMKLNPPKFMGATDPLVVEEWLKKLDAIFEVKEVIEQVCDMTQKDGQATSNAVIGTLSVNNEKAYVLIVQVLPIHLLLLLLYASR